MRDVRGTSHVSAVLPAATIGGGWREHAACTCTLTISHTHTDPHTLTHTVTRGIGPRTQRSTRRRPRARTTQ